MSLVKHLAKIDATLDGEDRCIFCGNYKVASLSVNQKILKGRAIRRKQGEAAYMDKLLSYSEEDIQNMFKFTIVRNPWDRAVSAFHYLQQVMVDPTRPGYRVIESSMSFEQFIIGVLPTLNLEFPDYRQRLEAHFSFQYSRAYYDDEQFVDHIAKLETLEDDWSTISPAIGIDKKMKHSNKSQHAEYEKYYTVETKRIISSIYENDIEFFGYKF